MRSRECVGLPASWVNGWLAAVGCTVLHPEIRLHWTEDGAPAAVLSAAKLDPVQAIVDAWPDQAMLDDLPIANEWRGAGVLERRVPVAEFVKRVRAARHHVHSWTLSSTLTDLYVDKAGEVSHGPFDPTGPGTIKWLHNRLVKAHRCVKTPSVEIPRSLSGRPVRVEHNGLGFDQARLGSLADKSAPWTDPVVEVLAFFGLSILPVRGRGVDERQHGKWREAQIQRGWKVPRTSTSRTECRFYWPAWRQPLCTAGIDALLDAWDPQRRKRWSRFGVHAGWRSVRYKGRGKSDRTNAIGAERI